MSAEWKARSRCIGHTDMMFDPARTDEALARCAICPVAEQCLQATMAAEAGEPYRYGVAGGYGPLDRERMAAGNKPLRHRKPLRPKITYRPWRKCKGCKAPIRQPRAGRPQVWCRSACQWRTIRDRQVDAAKARQRWSSFSDDEKEARRQAMRERWARLTPEERAELAAKRRTRRARAS